MKLECLAKIPFGLYAELERANSLLTEINTTDGDQCLESLKVREREFALACFQKVIGSMKFAEVLLYYSAWIWSKFVCCRRWPRRFS